MPTNVYGIKNYLDIVMENMLPDWIKTDVYNKVIELREIMKQSQQQGTIVISENQAFFQSTDNEIVDVFLNKEKKTRMRIIQEKASLYLDDLLRFEINPLPEVIMPYNNNEDNANKLSKLIQGLEQKRTARDRVKTLVYYYNLGKLLTDNGQQQLRQFGISEGRSRKLAWKSTRVYRLFKEVGLLQVYNTKIISTKIIADMNNDQFNNLINNIRFSQELNA